jgi:hypothetical protein
LRPALTGAALVLAIVAPAQASRPPPGSLGTVTGEIDVFADTSFGIDFAAIRNGARVVVRTGDGTAVGTLHYGLERRDPSGTGHLPYVVDNLPVGVALRVSAEPAAVAAPSPLPTGFFLTFRLTKSHGNAAVPYYEVTLRSGLREADDCDFTYATLEVPPALPATPGPSPPAHT